MMWVSDASTPRDSYGPKSFDDSNQGLAGEQPTDHDDDYHQPQKRKSIFTRPVFWLAASSAIVLIVLVVILPVYFTVIKKDKSAAASTANGTPQPTASGKPGSPTSMVTGGDGSIITTANGVNFTYKMLLVDFVGLSTVTYSHADLILLFYDQGMPIPTILLTTTPSQTPGLYPSIRVGLGGKIKSTGTFPIRLSQSIFPLSLTHFYMQCKSGRSICSRTFHFSRSLPGLPRSCGRVDAPHPDGR
jgi:hypothetical protein